MEKIDTDWKTTKLKRLAKLCKPFSRDWAPLEVSGLCVAKITQITVTEFLLQRTEAYCTRVEEEMCPQIANTSANISV